MSRGGSAVVSGGGRFRWPAASLLEAVGAAAACDEGTDAGAGGGAGADGAGAAGAGVCGAVADGVAWEGAGPCAA